MHDLVIVGTGYAGVWALLGAADLNRSHAAGRTLRIAVVAPSPMLVARPRLYEANLAEGDARLHLGPLIEEAGVEFIAGRVASVEEQRLQVLRPDGTASWLSCRTAVVAAGSAACLPGGRRIHNVDTYEAAASFWDAVRGLSATGSPRPTLVVVGAGHAGLEAATEAATRFANCFTIHLIDGAPSLRGWSAEAADHIHQRLVRLGIRLHLGTRLVAAGGGSVSLSDGSALPADLVLWTAGLRPSELVEAVRGARSSDGRVLVDRFLRQPEAPALFWAGDVAAAPTPDTGLTVMSCQHAMQMGTTAGRNAVLHLGGQPLEPFTPRPYVTCLGLGPDDALFTEGSDRNVRHTGMTGAQVKKYIVEQAIVPPATTRAAA